MFPAWLTWKTVSRKQQFTVIIDWHRCSKLSQLGTLRNFRGIPKGSTAMPRQQVGLSTESVRAGIGRIFELVDCRGVLIRA